MEEKRVSEHKYQNLPRYSAGSENEAVMVKKCVASSGTVVNPRQSAGTKDSQQIGKSDRAALVRPGGPELTGRQAYRHELLRIIGCEMM